MQITQRTEPPLWLVLRRRYGYASQEEMDGVPPSPRSASDPDTDSSIWSCSSGCQGQCMSSCQAFCMSSSQHSRASEGRLAAR